MVRITDKNTGTSYSGSSLNEAIDKMSRDPKSSVNTGRSTTSRPGISTPGGGISTESTATNTPSSRRSDTPGGFVDPETGTRYTFQDDLQDAIRSRQGRTPAPTGSDGFEAARKKFLASRGTADDFERLVNEIRSALPGTSDAAARQRIMVDSSLKGHWDNSATNRPTGPSGSQTLDQRKQQEAADTSGSGFDALKLKYGKEGFGGVIDWVVRQVVSGEQDQDWAVNYLMTDAMGQTPDEGFLGGGEKPYGQIEAIQLLTAGLSDAKLNPSKYGGSDSLANANNSSIANSASSSNPLLKNMFGGFDLTNLPKSELRPLDDAAFGAINDKYNLQGMSPAFSSVLRNRASASVPQFQLGAALGQFGQPGVSDNQIQMGGQGVQGLQQNAALGNLGGGPTSNSFQNFMQQAQNGLGQSGGQAASILEALGVTGAESAGDAYSGIASKFIAPRLGLLPQGLRNIVGAGIGGEIEQILGGKGSAEINPSEVLQQYQNRGLFF